MWTPVSGGCYAQGQGGVNEGQTHPSRLGPLDLTVRMGSAQGLLATLIGVPGVPCLKLLIAVQMVRIRTQTKDASVSASHEGASYFVVRGGLVAFG